ncbi:MAG: alcohol dehydrogenase catalytic domain-containing protein [Ferrimicrobium sp.]|nr:alcohol dehydrogenase catalytic domain-containing protein [Ferrimicrobium sp.]
MTARLTHAIVIQEPGHIRLTEIELDDPGPGEVEVQIASAGVCGSDLHVFRGDWDIHYPMVMGHEGAGYISKVGPGVQNLEIGDPVVLSWNAPCRQCRLCLSGKPYACERATAYLDEGGFLFDGTTRFHKDGKSIHHYLGVSSWSEAVVVPATGAIKVPTELNLVHAALAGCALPTGIGAVRNTAAISAGSRVLVIGCGGVGLSCVQGARLSKAEVIATTDKDASRLELARQLGATSTHETDNAILSHLADQYPGGFDAVFDAVGSITTMEMGLKLLAPAGSLVIIGLTRAGSRLTVDPLALAMNNQRILGSNYGSIDPAVDIPVIINAIANGVVDVVPLVSAEFPLGEAAIALENLAKGIGLRQLLIPTTNNAAPAP